MEVHAADVDGDVDIPAHTGQKHPGRLPGAFAVERRGHALAIAVHEH